MLLRDVSNLLGMPCWSKACRIQNPDIPRAGRVGAAHGGAAGRGGAGQDRTPTDRFDQKTSVPRTFQVQHRRQLSWTSFQKHKQAKYFLNQWRNKVSIWPAERNPLFVPGFWPMGRRLFVLVNPRYARQVRDFDEKIGSNSLKNNEIKQRSLFD